MKIVINLIITIALTVTTQIGGVLYLAILAIFKRRTKRIKLLIFLGVYIIFTFIIIPIVAPFFGRETIKNNECLKAHSFFYKLANRNYVTPELNKVLEKVSKQVSKEFKGVQLIYLDANFPFFNGFPLLPHLSHNDGKKIDITFVYTDKRGNLTNKKPSISGYGAFESPTKLEYNQTEICKKRGFWQYDFTKYLTLGTVHKNLAFSNKVNKRIILLLLQEKTAGKLFIEPHLVKRMRLTHRKIRFQGCKAVRHDDHIHFQLR